MADYLVTDSELTSIANAIRTKGGTSANLSFPTEFVSAISNIPSGGGGLEYESGTWTPSTDIARYTIPFANTHAVAPPWYMIVDATGTDISSDYTNIGVFYQNYHQMFGAYNSASGGIAEYGYVTTRYIPTGTVLSGSTFSLNEPYTSSASSANTKPRYWATETGIKAFTGSTSRYWRAGRTYKWIAVWPPTT